MKKIKTEHLFEISFPKECPCYVLRTRATTELGALSRSIFAYNKNIEYNCKTFQCNNSGKRIILNILIRSGDYKIRKVLDTARLWDWDKMYLKKIKDPVIKRNKKGIQSDQYTLF